MENLPQANTDNTYDTIIIGGGISGLTAGIYTARAAQKTLIIEGDYNSNIDMPGGQLILTPEIENFPGFKKGSGYDLIEIVKEQAEDSGCEIITANATGFDLIGENGLRRITTNYDETYYAKSIILATGAIARRLGVEGEDALYGKGVSACATCDGAFFANKKVAVVGGGDTAVEDALYLTAIAEEVILIHRRDELRSDGPEARKLLEAPNARIIWNSTVKSIHGDGKVEKITLTHLDGTESELETSALFVAIGHDPATKHFHGIGVEIRGDQYLVERDTLTNIPGVFAAGDVADSIYRQAITAAATGAKAGMNAIKFNKTV